jgi:hypothetical protein
MWDNRKNWIAFLVVLGLLATNTLGQTMVEELSDMNDNLDGLIKKTEIVNNRTLYLMDEMDNIRRDLGQELRLYLGIFGIMGAVTIYASGKREDRKEDT